MNESDDRTFERFARRLAAIEAEVKDPPPFSTARGGGPVLLRPGRRSISGLVAALAVVVAVVAVAPLISNRPPLPPTSSQAAVVGGSNGPARSASPSSSPSATSIMVDKWPASCVGVEPDVCQRVAALAINNLARNQPSGPLTVVSRPVCPLVPDWADGTRCWQVYTPLLPGTVCMVIAKRSADDQYGQVAGDEPGRATSPGDIPGCPPDEALVPLDPASPPEDVPGSCQTVVVMEDRALTTIEQDAENSTAVVIGTVTGIGEAQWNTPLGDRPTGTSIGPSQVFRLIRVDVRTVVKGSVPTVLTLWIPGGQIGCHGFWGGIRGSGRPDVGSRYALFLGNAASRTRRALPGIVPAWQIWSIEGDIVTTTFEGRVPLATFIKRASVH